MRSINYMLQLLQNRRLVYKGSANLEFFAGTDIMEAAEAAIALASFLRGSVTFRFNGKDMTALPDGSPEELSNSYFSSIQKKGTS